MKLGGTQIQLMNALNSIAKADAKDCFVDGEVVVFLVPEEDMRKAIGKNGSTVETLRKKLGKRVELFEYSQEPEKFLKRAFFKASINGVEIKNSNEKKVAVVNVDSTNKRIILQNMSRLRKVKELAKRNFEIDEIRIR